MKLIDKIQKNVFNILIIFLIILNILPFIAPLAAKLDIVWLSKSIYIIYSLSCHQFHWRSLHLFDYQIGWCTRCTFIWLAFLLVTILVKLNFFRKKIYWYWILPFLIPIAIDGGIQTIATLIGLVNFSDKQFYLATNFTRFVTGSLFGIGLGLVIAPFLNEEQKIIKKSLKEKIPYAKAADSIYKKNTKMNIKLLKKILMTFILLFIFYLILIFLWKITSPYYPPKNFLDHYVRKAPNTRKWGNNRRDHSI